MVPSPPIVATVSALSDLITALVDIHTGSKFVDAAVCNALYGFTSYPRRGSEMEDSYPFGREGGQVAPDYAPVSRHLEATRTIFPEDCVYALYTTFSGKARAEIYGRGLGTVAHQKDHVADDIAMAFCKACLTARRELLIIKDKIERGEMIAP